MRSRAVAETCSHRTQGRTRNGAFMVLWGGQTISQYATSLGKDPQAVADALTKAADARIDKAVANGRLDPSRAATLKSKVGARVDHFLNRTWGQKAAAGTNA